MYQLITDATADLSTELLDEIPGLEIIPMEIVLHGMELDELADWVEETKLSVCHWFTVDTLEYLKKGGRISPAAAAIGNVLKIKRVLLSEFIQARECRLLYSGETAGRRISVLRDAARSFR